MIDELNQPLRWVETFAYQAGKPIRLMPTGTFRRGARTFTISRADLEQMAANYDSGRPRWKVPLYFGHPTKENMDPPKAGNIARVYVADDDKGRPALFGVPEYTTDALQAVEGGAYQYVSPGVLWSKNGSAYADEGGRSWDNVLEHVAFTNRPFFGEHTAVFSADDEAGSEMMSDNSDAHLRARAKAMDDLAAIGQQIVDISKGGWAMALPEHKRPMVEIEVETDGDEVRDVTLATSAKADDLVEDQDKEKGMAMDDNTQANTFSVNAEEFAALTQQAAEAATAKARTAELEAELATIKRSARLATLKGEAETFSALSLPTDELAEKLFELEEKAGPDLYGYFVAALKTANGLAGGGENFEQKTVENAKGATAAETFEAAVEQVHAEEFGADPRKFGAAMNRAAEKFPELARQYAGTGR